VTKQSIWYRFPGEEMLTVNRTFVRHSRQKGIGLILVPAFFFLACTKPAPTESPYSVTVAEKPVSDINKQPTPTGLGKEPSATVGKTGEQVPNPDGSPTPQEPTGDTPGPTPSSSDYDVNPTHWTKCLPVDSHDPPTCGRRQTNNEPLKIDDCPQSSRIAIIVDDDSVTRNAGKWEWLQRDTWAVSSPECDRAGQPLARDLAGWCETIQRFGARNEPSSYVPCVPTNRRRSRQNHGGDASRTPVALAMERTCQKLGNGLWDVAIVAFDGVPDAPSQGSPTSEFVEKVSDCVRSGLVLHVVAHPESYRYLYILSNARFSQYSWAVATTLKNRMPDTSDDAVVLSLTPYQLLVPGTRREAAKIELDRLQPSSHPEDVWTDLLGYVKGTSFEFMQTVKLNLSHWLGNENSNRIVFEWTWVSSQSAWNELVSAGLDLPPPSLFSNRKLNSTPDNAALTTAGDLVVTTWDQQTCPGINMATMRRNSRAMAKRAPCLEPQTPIFQAINAKSLQGKGALVFQLAKDPDRPDWINRTGLAFGETDSELEVRQFVAGMSRTRNLSLTSMAMVSPAVEIHDCVFELNRGLLGSHRWAEHQDSNDMIRSQAPGVFDKCAATPLHPLVQAFSRTESMRFPQTVGGHPGGTNLRCGMETLASVIDATARITTQEKGHWEKATSSCTLQALQAVFECPMPGI